MSREAPADESTRDAPLSGPASGEGTEGDGAPVADRQADALESTDDDNTGREAVSTATKRRRFPIRVQWSRVLVIGVLPAVAMLLTVTAAWFKWQYSSARADEQAGREAVQAASESTVAILSYSPATVEKDLGGAESRLTGTFRDSYDQLTHSVVIPGSKQRQIASVATVPAAAVVKASGNHAVVLLAVNQSVTMGKDAPSQTASSVRVTLDKIDGRWLISEFDPV